MRNTEDYITLHTQKSQKRAGNFLLFFVKIKTFIKLFSLIKPKCKY